MPIDKEFTEALDARIRVDLVTALNNLSKSLNNKGEDKIASEISKQSEIIKDFTNQVRSLELNKPEIKNNSIPLFYETISSNLKNILLEVKKEKVWEFTVVRDPLDGFIESVIAKQIK